MFHARFAIYLLWTAYACLLRPTIGTENSDCTSEYREALEAWKRGYESYTGNALNPSASPELNDEELLTRMNEIDWISLAPSFFVGPATDSASPNTLLLKFSDSAHDALNEIGPSLKRKMMELESNPDHPVNPTKLRGAIAVPFEILRMLYSMELSSDNDDEEEDSDCFINATDFPVTDHYWIGWVDPIPNEASAEIALTMECFDPEELRNITTTMSTYLTSNSTRRHLASTRTFYDKMLVMTASQNPYLSTKWIQGEADFENDLGFVPFESDYPVFKCYDDSTCCESGDNNLIAKSDCGTDDHPHLERGPKFFVFDDSNAVAKVKYVYVTGNTLIRFFEKKRGEPEEFLYQIEVGATSNIYKVEPKRNSIRRKSLVAYVLDLTSPPTPTLPTSRQGSWRYETAWENECFDYCGREAHNHRDFDDVKCDKCLQGNYPAAHGTRWKMPYGELCDGWCFKYVQTGILNYVDSYNAESCRTCLKDASYAGPWTHGSKPR